MKKTRKLIGSLLLVSMFMAGAAFAVDVAGMDVVQTYSATDIDHRWTYIFQNTKGLDINQYEVTVGASTIAYGNNHAYVTAVLQQKQANGSYEDYAEFSSDSIGGAAVSPTLTVPYGTYRIVSYHSAGNGTNMEYKTLTGPDKRVPHDTGK